MYNLYTDGACSVSTGYGGWGCILTDVNDREVTRAKGGARDTTNNRMELMAVLEGLTYLMANGIKEVVIYTDSAYVANCFVKQWWKKWLANGWKKANGVAIKNQDLWAEIFKILLRKNNPIQFEFRHMNSHPTKKQLAEMSDEERKHALLNEECDVLAVEAKEEIRYNDATINFN